VLDTARVVATLPDALAGCVFAAGFSARPREFAGKVLTVREAAAHAVAASSRGDVALVFGTEMSGLSNDELERCHAVATIAASPEYASLNLAAAVQVACYEARVAATGGAVWSAPRFTPATVDEIEALRAHATRTLIAMRFLNPRMPKRLLPRLARLFARAGLEKEEVNILRGILTRIDELLGRVSKP
jgi:tRNA/rRNA methyltransferase